MADYTFQKQQSYSHFFHKYKVQNLPKAKLYLTLSDIIFIESNRPVVCLADWLWHAAAILSIKLPMYSAAAYHDIKYTITFLPPRSYPSTTTLPATRPTCPRLHAEYVHHHSHHHSLHLNSFCFHGHKFVLLVLTHVSDPLVSSLYFPPLRLSVPIQPISHHTTRAFSQPVFVVTLHTARTVHYRLVCRILP